jgi:hypothetical protein
LTRDGAGSSMLLVESGAHFGVTRLKWEILA